MKELPSRQFRTTYPRLTEPVGVTVSGHPIGIWLPFRSTVPITITGPGPKGVVVEIGEPEEIDVTDPRHPVPVVRDYAPRTFIPVPKPGKR